MDLASSAVAALMHQEFSVLHPDDLLDSVDPIAGELRTTRHLVVVDAALHVVGILSLRDLLEASLARIRMPDPECSALRSVSDLMTRPVETVGPEEVLAAAANRMICHRIGCLPVVRADGVMIGVVTDADLIEAAYRPDRDLASTESASGSPRR